MYFCQNHTIFMKKVVFFSKKGKSGCFREIGSPQHFYLGKSSKFMISILCKRRWSITYFLHSARTTATGSNFTPFYPNSPATTLIQLTKQKLIRTYFQPVAIFFPYGTLEFWGRYYSCLPSREKREFTFFHEIQLFD